MDRRTFAAMALSFALAPQAGRAQTAESQVISQLQRQGYSRITMRRTLLGRTRIVAFGPNGRREIILNPSTGAILRDYVDRDSTALNGGRDDDRDDDDSGRGRGRGGDDDRDDSDDNDDNRGSGGDRDDDDDDDDD